MTGRPWPQGEISLHGHAPDRQSPPPLRYSIAWESTEVSIAGIRDAVRALLDEADTDLSSRQEAQLVVTELVTNALRHAPGPGSLALSVQPSARLLEITVCDSSTAPLRPQKPDAGRIGGHGLLLVSRLCSKVGTIVNESGKQTVAYLQLGDSRDVQSSARVNPVQEGTADWNDVSC